MPGGSIGEICVVPVLKCLIGVIVFEPRLKVKDSGEVLCLG